MLEPAFIGSSRRVDVRSVAEMRRVLIPFEDESTRHGRVGGRDPQRAVAAARKSGVFSYESIATELFKQFAKDASAAKKRP